jgi:hypothetical protein
VTNDSDKALELLTYQIDYRLGRVPAEAGYFHAQWRRATVKRSDPVYTILNGVKGSGRYVGTFLAWTQLVSGWFGEDKVVSGQRVTILRRSPIGTRRNRIRRFRHFRHSLNDGSDEGSSLTAFIRWHR